MGYRLPTQFEIHQMRIEAARKYLLSAVPYIAEAQSTNEPALSAFHWREAFQHAFNMVVYLTDAAARHEERVTELLLANNREVERRRATYADDHHGTDVIDRPMATVPRDGTLVRLLVDGVVTVGWYDDRLAHTSHPLVLLDSQTGPGRWFVNRAIDSLPTAWAPMGAGRERKGGYDDKV